MGTREATSIPSCGRHRAGMDAGAGRGVANVFWSAGSFVGPAIGAIVVAAVASAWGWRIGFVVLGALGFIWLASKWYLVRSPRTRDLAHGG